MSRRSPNRAALWRAVLLAQLAHLKRASSGHLLKASSGHMSKGCNPCQDSVTIEISGVDSSICTGCRSGPGSDYHTNDELSGVDGTYTVPFDSFNELNNACDYKATVSAFLQQTRYFDSGCTDVRDTGSDDTMEINVSVDQTDPRKISGIGFDLDVFTGTVFVWPGFSGEDPVTSGTTVDNKSDCSPASGGTATVTL